MMKQYGSVSKQVMVALISAAFHISCGYNITYSGIIVPQLLLEKDTSPVDTSPGTISWIVSAGALGIPLGGILCGFIIDRFGRLNSLKLSSIPCVAGWVLIATAKSSGMIIFGRILTGYALSLQSNCGYVYITEISQPSLRGALLAVPSLYISLGFLLTYIQGRFMHWRWVAWTMAAYSVICTILLFLIRESPSWLISKNRQKNTVASLRWFLNNEADAVDNNMVLLLKENALKMESIKKVTFATFTLPTVYKPFAILLGLSAMQQFSGVFVIMGNSIVFFMEIGVTYDLYFVTMSLGLVRLLVAVASIWMNKRFSRRILLLTSSVGMAVSLFLSALFTPAVQRGHVDKMWIPIVLTTIYFFFASYGLLTIPFSMMPEMFPLNVRGTMQSVCFSLSFLFSFVALHTYNALLGFFGGVTGLQYFYAIISLGCAIYCYVFVPETFRKELADIEEYFWRHFTYLSV